MAEIRRNSHVQQFWLWRQLVTSVTKQLNVDKRYQNLYAKNNLAVGNLLNATEMSCKYN